MFSCFAFRENFAKLKENYAKHDINNFAKFSRKHENENFRSHPTSRTPLQVNERPAETSFRGLQFGGFVVLLFTSLP